MKPGCARMMASATLSLLLLGCTSSLTAATMVGPLFPINDDGAFYLSIAYNPYSDEYLAIWVDVTDANGWQAKVRRIDADTGSLLGSEFYVSNDPSAYPAIIARAAYNTVNHEWFIVYQGTLVQYDDVVAQRIADDGTKIGEHIPLVARAGYQNGAEVVHDPINNRYLVVWLEPIAGRRQVMGRFFDQYGTPLGAEIQIRQTGVPYDAHNARVAYNPVAHEFMVVWQDYRNYTGVGQDNGYSDIYGQRIDAGAMAKIGGNIAIYVPQGTPYVPNGQDIPGQLVCNTSDGRYILSIQKLTDAEYYRTYGLVINYDGSWSGTGLFTVSHPDFGVPTGLGYDPTSNTCVFTYEDLTAGHPDVVRGRQFTASGSPIGEPFTANMLGGGTVRDGVLAVRPTDGQYLQIACTDQNGTIYGQRFVMEPDTFPPGRVNPLRAFRQSETSVLLTWANPADADFRGTMVRCRADTFPTSPADGVLVCDRAASPGSSDSFIHSMTPGQSYYYAAFAYDSIPNFSAATNATPSEVWLDEPFDNYCNGPLDGQGGWTRDASKNSCILQESVRAGDAGRAVEIFGSSTVYDDATLANFGIISGGYHKVSFDMCRSTSATNNQGFIAILQGSTILTRVYWSTNFNMLHGPGVSFTELVAAPLSGRWYHVEIGIDLSSGKLDAWIDGVQKVAGKPFYQAASHIDTINLTGYSSAVAASYLDNLKGERVQATAPPSAPIVISPECGSTVYTPRPRIIWFGSPHDAYEVHISTSNSQDNDLIYDSGAVSSGDNAHVAGPLPASGYCYIFVRLKNNFGWGGWSAAGCWFRVADDGADPGAPRDFNAMGSNGAIRLTWTNPPDPDLSSIVIRCRNDGYPMTQDDGTLVTLIPGSEPGATMSFIHSGLANGTKVFYSAFALDNWGRYSSAATDFSTPEVWALEYQADVLPSVSSPAWTILDDGGSESYSHIEPAGGILHILDDSTAWGSKIRWYRNWGAPSSMGATVLIRAMCDSLNPDAYATNVTLCDGTRYINFVIFPDRVASKANATTGLDRQYLLDGTKFHKYRFTLKNGVYSCYVDENYAPVFTGTAYSTNDPNRILIGANGSGTTQSIYYDYVCYRVDGAFAPTGGAADVNVLGAKLSADGASVRILGAVITAAFRDYFYVQDPDLLCGIRVDMPSHGRSLGEKADIVGRMKTSPDDERSLLAESVIARGTGSVHPIAMNSSCLGGSDLLYNPQTGAGQRGIGGGMGPNNVGLLIKTWGKVTAVDPVQGCFWIDGGCGPIRVWTSDPPEPGAGFLIVTGVSVLDAREGSIKPAIRVRSPVDIMPAR